MSYLRYLCLFVYSGVQHILCCVCVCLRPAYSILPVSRDCLFLIAPSALTTGDKDGPNIFFYAEIVMDITTRNSKLKNHDHDCAHCFVDIFLSKSTVLKSCIYY
jgi:hypothetical protein